MPSSSEIKVPSVELQAQSGTTELAINSELQQKIKDLGERLHKKEIEVSEMTAKLAEVSKIKSQLDEANACVDALGKRCFSSIINFNDLLYRYIILILQADISSCAE